MTHGRTQAVIGGALAGLAGGFFGVGGGLVLVPMLIGRFKLTQHQAHGTSLAIVGAAALLSMVVYALHGNVAWVTAAIVAVASIVTARWGAQLATRTPAGRLAQAFAVLLVLVALRLVWKTPHGGGSVHTGTFGTLTTELAIGLVVGLFAGYMGVGGGVIAVPAFTLLLGMTQQNAQGTSLAVILVTAPSGALEHYRHGNVVTRLVPPFALGAALAGPLASQLVHYVPQALLVRAFAVFLIVNAVLIWIRSGRRHAEAVT